MATLARLPSTGVDEPSEMELVEWSSTELTNRNRRNIFREISKSFPKLGLTRNNEDLKRLLRLIKNNEDLESYITDIMAPSLSDLTSIDDLDSLKEVTINRNKTDGSVESFNVTKLESFSNGLEKEIYKGIIFDEKNEIGISMPRDILLIIHKNKILGDTIRINQIFNEIFINAILSLFESKFLRKDKYVPEGVANMITNSYVLIDGEIHLISLINKFDGDLNEYINLQKDNCTCNLSELVKDLFFQVSNTYEILHNVFQFQHNDLHLGNIFYKNKGNQNISYLMGDFGLSSIRIYVDSDILPDHDPRENIFIAKKSKINQEIITLQNDGKYCIDYDFYKMALFTNITLKSNGINVNEIMFNNTTDKIRKINSVRKFKNSGRINLMTVFTRIGVIKELYLDLIELNYNFIKNINDYLIRIRYPMNLHETYFKIGPIPVDIFDEDHGTDYEEPPLIPFDDKKYYKKYIKYKSKYLALKVN